MGDDNPISHRLWFWDAMIAIGLTVFTVAALGSLWAFVRGFGSTPQLIAGIVSLVIVMMILYGTFIEPKRIVTKRRLLPLANQHGLRIAIASDFHVGPLKAAPFVARVVERINALEPDLVLLPGDFIYDEHSDHRELAPLQRLRSKHGVFAVVGNHDTGSYMDLSHKPFRGPDRSATVAAFLEERGIAVLRNAMRTMNIRGQDIALHCSPHSRACRKKFRRFCCRTTPMSSNIRMRNARA
jgi:predicted MPP superfamily phosphohydrolase